MSNTYSGRLTQPPAGQRDELARRFIQIISSARKRSVRPRWQSFLVL